VVPYTDVDCAGLGNIIYDLDANMRPPSNKRKGNWQRGKRGKPRWGWEDITLDPKKYEV
jgi:hypothetical protein